MGLGAWGGYTLYRLNNQRAASAQCRATPCCCWWAGIRCDPAQCERRGTCMPITYFILPQHASMQLELLKALAAATRPQRQHPEMSRRKAQATTQFRVPQRTIDKQTVCVKRWVMLSNRLTRDRGSRKAQRVTAPNACMTLGCSVCLCVCSCVSLGMWRV